MTTPPETLDGSPSLPTGTRRGPCPQSVSAVRRLLRSEVMLVLVLTAVSNVFLFGFVVTLARTLRPSAYGLFASLFSLVVLMGLAASAMQNSVAARIAALRHEDTPKYLRSLAFAVGLITLLVGLIGIAIAPAISEFIHAAGPLLPGLVMVIAALLVPWSALLGVLQGQRRFTEYGILVAFQAASRLAAAATLLLTHSLVFLLLAVIVATAVPSLVGGAIVVGRGRTAGSKAPRLALANVKRAPTYLRTFLVSLAVGFPTVGDVFLVRHAEKAELAGSYAAVALVGRCIVFVSMGINAVYIPRLVAAAEAERRGLARRAVGAVVIAGTIPAAAALLAPSLVLHHLVGTAYKVTPADVRLYAVAGLVFAAASTCAFGRLVTVSRWALEAFACVALAVQIAVPLLVGNVLPHLLEGEVGAALVVFLGAIALGSRQFQAAGATHEAVKI